MVHMAVGKGHPPEIRDNLDPRLPAERCVQHRGEFEQRNSVFHPGTRIGHQGLHGIRRKVEGLAKCRGDRGHLPRILFSVGTYNFNHEGRCRLYQRMPLTPRIGVREPGCQFFEKTPDHALESNITMARDTATRLFVDGPLTVSAEPLALPGAAAHHLATVLRARTGAEIILFNGHGGAFRGTLVEVQRRAVRCLITEHLAEERRSPLRIHLVQALAKGTRMDLVVQKATELGVSSVRPLASARSNVRLDAERATDRLEHWERIAIAACEQCGRNDLPEIRPVATVAELVPVEDGTLGLIADPNAKLRLRELFETTTVTPARPAGFRPELTLVIGPEGGLSSTEITELTERGFQGVGLGPRILRTETAGLAALSALQALFGDL